MNNISENINSINLECFSSNEFKASAKKNIHKFSMLQHIWPASNLI